MADILNIGGEPIFDDRVVKIETHTYNPYATNVWTQRRDKNTHTTARFIHVTMRKFSVRRGKIDGKERERRVTDNAWKLIALHSCLTKFDMNSMALRLIVTETLELSVLSRIVYR